MSYNLVREHCHNVSSFVGSRDLSDELQPRYGNKHYRYIVVIIIVYSVKRAKLGKSHGAGGGGETVEK